MIDKDTIYIFINSFRNNLVNYLDLILVNIKLMNNYRTIAYDLI